MAKARTLPALTARARKLMERYALQELERRISYFEILDRDLDACGNAPRFIPEAPARLRELRRLLATVAAINEQKEVTHG